MDLEIVILSEASQTEDENYMWNLKKYIQMNLSTKQTHENGFVVTKERGGRMDWEFRISKEIILQLKKRS